MLTLQYTESANQKAQPIDRRSLSPPFCAAILFPPNETDSIRKGRDSFPFLCAYRLCSAIKPPNGTPTNQARTSLPFAIKAHSLNHDALIEGSKAFFLGPPAIISSRSL
jgi:hypothetical protein